MSASTPRLRGIYSEADIKARCEIVGDCWIWQGSKTSSGYATISKDGRVQTVTTWLFEFLKGRPVKPGHVIKMRCRDPHCVSPACMVESSRSQLVRDQWENGRRSRLMSPERRKALRGNAIASGWAKLDEEKASQIRSLHKTGLLYKQIAPMFGVSASTVGRIVRRECWSLHVPNSSVFAWRPAA